MIEGLLHYTETGNKFHVQREHHTLRYASTVSHIEISQSDYQVPQFALWPYYTGIIPHLFQWLQPFTLSTDSAPLVASHTNLHSADRKVTSFAIKRKKQTSTIRVTYNCPFGYCSCNISRINFLAPEIFFLILAHPVYKM